MSDETMVARWLLAAVCLGQASLAADCPSMCKCLWKSGKQTVECAEQGLLTIPALIDSDTQVLDLSGNNIQILASKKFQRMSLTNLQRIYLARCKIAQVDEQALLGLTNLVELDLSDNFLTQVPSGTLGDVPALMSLLLSGNPLRRLSRASFAGLRELSTLEMSRCELADVEPGVFAELVNLKSLLLDGNRLTQLEVDGLSLALHRADLHANPWTCDCRLRALRRWLVQYPVPPLEEPRCEAPLRLRGRVIRGIDERQLACLPEISPSSMFQEVAEDHNVSFSCRVKAIPPANVTWSFNEQPLGDSSTLLYRPYAISELSEQAGTVRTSQLVVVNASDEDQGVFRCQASNEAGTRISNFTLGVLMPPGSSVSELAPPSPRNSYIAAVGASIVFLLVVLVILICIIAIRCSRRRRARKHQAGAATVTIKSSKSGEVMDTATNPVGMSKAAHKSTSTVRGGDDDIGAGAADCREHVTYIGQRCCTSPSRQSTDGTDPDVISDTESADRRGSTRHGDTLAPLSEPVYEHSRRAPRLGSVWRSDDPAPLVHVDVHQGCYPADFGLPRSATMGRSRSYHNHISDGRLGSGGGVPNSYRSLPRHRHSRPSRRDERELPPPLLESAAEMPPVVRNRPVPPLRTSASLPTPPAMSDYGAGEAESLPLQELPPERMGLPSPPVPLLDGAPTLAPPAGFTDDESPLYSHVQKRRGDPNTSGLPPAPAKCVRGRLAAQTSTHESPDEGYEESAADGTDV